MITFNSLRLPWGDIANFLFFQKTLDMDTLKLKAALIISITAINQVIISKETFERFKFCWLTCLTLWLTNFGIDVLWKIDMMEPAYQG
jgi:hypothetical protein